MAYDPFVHQTWLQCYCHGCNYLSKSCKLVWLSWRYFCLWIRLWVQAPFEPLVHFYIPMLVVLSFEWMSACLAVKEFHEGKEQLSLPFNMKQFNIFLLKYLLYFNNSCLATKHTINNCYSIFCKVLGNAILTWQTVY